MLPSDEELAAILQEFGKATDVSPVQGGCISAAYRVAVQRPSGETCDVFVKRNALSFLDNFVCESQGLEKLAEVDAIRVPKLLKVENACGYAWLVTEWIDTCFPSSLKARGQDFYENFGTRLALLHLHSRCQRIGLERNNYLGSAQQFNTPEATWIEFVGQHRLGFQLRWAIEQGQANELLRDLVARVIDCLPELLDGRERSSSLLHGDLWSGNYLSDTAGQPVLIDPAIYYGCREAEFGMLHLFGNCPPRFYAAYHATYPLAAGWRRRADVYQLYHLLNHLNLFGTSYLGQSINIATKILSSRDG